MDINATLLVEMVIFLLFFLITKHYIWPPIVTVLDERREVIQKGLQQADEAKNELAKAHEKAEDTIHLAAQKAKKVVEDAQKEATALVNETKKACQERLVKHELELEKKTQQAHQRARKKIEHEMLNLSTEICRKILKDAFDNKTTTQLLRAQTETND
jgi:F-type H+-transporting ATPase subunit b